MKLSRNNRSVSLHDAFTLVEMLVVIAMLGILMTSMITGIAQARRQARITRANAECRELVNAWLAYEQAYDDDPITIRGDEIEASEGNLSPLLGSDGGLVFLNAPMKNGHFLDPWGKPYRFRISRPEVNTDSTLRNEFKAAVTFPNRNIAWR